MSGKLEKFLSNLIPKKILTKAENVIAPDTFAKKTIAGLNHGLFDIFSGLCFVILFKEIRAYYNLKVPKNQTKTPFEGFLLFE